MQDTSGAVGSEVTVQALCDPKETEEGKGKCAPMDEGAGALVLEAEQEQEMR